MGPGSPSWRCAGSSGSSPASTVSNNAASAIVVAIGPAVSCMWEIGMIPARLTSPTVGLIPTMPHMPDGDTIDPFVSVPTARGAYPAATATPEPELDPDGFRSSWYGFTVCPPRPLHPLIEYCDRIF